MSVELGRARRQNEERYSAGLTGVLEFGHEFRTAIDLDSPDGECHPAHDRIQEAGRRVSGGAVMHLEDLQAAEDVAGGEVFEAEAVEEGDVSGVQLHDGARTVRLILLRLTDPVRPLERTSGQPGVPARRFDQSA